MALLLIGEMTALALGLDTGILAPANGAAWLLFSMAMVGAISLRSLSPDHALALLWVAVLLQLATGIDVAPLDAGILLVLYSLSVQPDSLRNGLAWITALSAIPLAMIFFVTRQSWVVDLGTSIWSRPSLSVLLGLFLAFCAVFILPVLLGTLVRALRRGAADRAARQAAEAQAERARELAQATVTREQIARDVHDMVGHSLAVIIAQAESMAYLPTDDPRYQQAGSNIAATAREALTEVRRIVDVAMRGPEQTHATGQQQEDQAQVLQLADAPDLIARLRDTGWSVQEHSDGVPQPLAPDVSAAGAVALREVITNVLKHGDRDQPVTVRWVWDAVLCLHVENGVRSLSSSTSDQPPANLAAPPRVGKGLISLRERLAAVGGRFSAHAVEPERYRASICVPLANTHAQAASPATTTHTRQREEW